MAFSGLHVACCFTGIPGGRDSEMPIISTPVWSESPSADTPTTNVAPNIGDVSIPGRGGQPVFRIRAAADSYVSIAAAPNAATSPRHLISSGVDYDIAVQPGDKLEWIAA